MDNLNKSHGCFLGVMIGDALGAAVEMMKPEDILAKTEGKGITSFDHPVRRKQFRSETIKLTTPVDLGAVLKGDTSDKTLAPITKLKKDFRETLVRFGLVKKPEPNPNLVIVTTHEVPEVPHGSTTDDWQLTDAVRKSLIRRKRFDITDVALTHIEAYQTSTSGWGGTTRNGMKELQEYFATKGSKGRSPLDAPVAAEGRGSGNGIAMKITPLALMHMLQSSMLTGEFSPVDFDTLGHQCADIGKLTHSDARAWAAAYALACVLVESPVIFKTNASTEKMELLKKVIEHLSPFERKYGSGGLKRFSSYLKVLLDESLLFGPIENLRDKVGTGCIAIESVVFAIALFLRNPIHFKSGVLEAVNSGGDTDTVASMVGGLIGSLVGPQGIPADWIQHNAEFAKAEDAAKELVTTFTV